MIPLYLSLAGGVGAVARFTTDSLVRVVMGRDFPWGTLTINILGSFVLGLLTGLVISHQASSDAKLIIGTGFCGGFTTFSTASFEAVRLIEERRFAATFFQIAGNAALTLLAVVAGMRVA